MNGIAVYLEGGGDTAESKASIRFGMAQFLGALRDAARRKHWHWKVVPCGSRVAARDAFLNARTTDAESHAILLVDSEAPVAGSPTAHLRARDGWILTGVPDDDVHFMAQVMETWIVSDPEALQTYYGNEFNRNALPTHATLEQVEKTRIAQSLDDATRRTQKGPYHKIHHGGPLLQTVRTAIVRQRCSYCERLFSIVGPLVA